MAEELPKGLYKGEDGIERYWNGSQWLEPQNVTAKKPIPAKKLALIGVIGATILASGFGITSFVQGQNEQAAKAKFEERAAEVKSYFKNVVEGCGASAGIQFDEQNLTIDGEGEEDSSGAGYFDVICIVMDAGMPPAVKSRFDNTNSLQGLLEDSWMVLDGDAEIFASWSYHPNSGPSVAMELSSVYLEPFNYEKHKELVDQQNNSTSEETP